MTLLVPAAVGAYDIIGQGAPARVLQISLPVSADETM